MSQSRHTGVTINDLKEARLLYPVMDGRWIVSLLVLAVLLTAPSAWAGPDWITETGLNGMDRGTQAGADDVLQPACDTATFASETLFCSGRDAVSAADSVPYSAAEGVQHAVDAWWDSYRVVAAAYEDLVQAYAEGYGDAVARYEAAYDDAVTAYEQTAAEYEASHQVYTETYRAMQEHYDDKYGGTVRSAVQSVRTVGDNIPDYQIGSVGPQGLLNTLAPKDRQAMMYNPVHFPGEIWVVLPPAPPEPPVRPPTQQPVPAPATLPFEPPSDAPVKLPEEAPLADALSGRLGGEQKEGPRHIAPPPSNTFGAVTDDAKANAIPSQQAEPAHRTVSDSPEESGHAVPGQPTELLTGTSQHIDNLPLVVSVIVAAAAGLGILALLVQAIRYALNLLPGACVLFSRACGEEVLKDPKRSMIHDAIVAHPGTTIQQLSEILNMNRETLRYHLYVLFRERLISAQDQGRTRHLFPISHGAPSKPEVISCLNHHHRSRLAKTILERPGLSQGKIAQMLDIFPSQVHIHTEHLAEVGLIESVRQGRHRLYFATPLLQMVGKRLG